MQVDKRVLFFPRTASSGDKAVATVDVFRHHEGRWYQRPYTVIPGSTIGGVDPPVEKKKKTLPARPITGRRALGNPGRTAILPSPMTPAELAKINFRTVVTIIDITPKTVHWYSSGSSNSLNQQTTPDLVYRDVDGFVKSVPVDNRCWPKELRQLRADILKKIREAETQSLTPQRLPDRRQPGRPPGGGSYYCVERVGLLGGLWSKRRQLPSSWCSPFRRSQRNVPPGRPSSKKSSEHWRRSKQLLKASGGTRRTDTAPTWNFFSNWIRVILLSKQFYSSMFFDC